MDNESLNLVWKHLWMAKEEADFKIEKLNQTYSKEELQEIFGFLEKNSWIKVSDGKFHFLPEGERKLNTFIRRLRLAERLHYDVLAKGEISGESGNCDWNYFLSPEAIESVCSLLGHPPLCPHGREIPPGECCRKRKKELKPLVVPLSEIKIGERVKIIFISPGFHSRMQRLLALGVFPANKLKLKQKKPAYVIEVDQTEIAIDDKIAKGIFVMLI